MFELDIFIISSSLDLQWNRNQIFINNEFSRENHLFIIIQNANDIISTNSQLG